MKDAQEVFNRLKAKKTERRKVNESLRDALANSKSYQDVLDKLGELREKKKSLEQQIYADFQADLSMMEGLAMDIKSDAQLLSDLTLDAFVKGHTIEIKDEYDVEYEPVFNVKFKKAS